MFLGKHLLSIAFLLACCVSVDAQKNSKTDSLQSRLTTAAEDTNKVKLMLALSDQYNATDPNEGLKWAGESQKLAQKFHWEIGKANALLSMGNAYLALSKFDAAQKSNLAAEEIYKNAGNKNGVAKAKNANGKIYLGQGKYPEALKNCLEALKLAEETKDESLQAQAKSHIGGIYFRQGENKEALGYFISALQQFEKLGQKKGAGLVLSNIGAISLGDGKVDTALVYLKKALQINEEIGAVDVAAMNIANIAGAYMMQGKFNQSLVYTFKSLRINQQTEDKNNIGIDMLNIGEAYFNIATNGEPIIADSLVPAGKQAVLAKAIQFAGDAEKTLSSVGGDINALSEAYKLLSKAYEASGNSAIALQHYKTYKMLKDSVFSIDNSLKVADLSTERAKLEKEQQVKINQLQKVKSRNETIAWIAGSVLLLFVIFFVARERRRSDKLLLNILPEEVARELKKKGGSDAKYFDEVTVLFTDFVNFTVLAERLSPQALVDELHACFKAFDGIMGKYKIEKIKTVGDAYLAVSGLPLADKNHAGNVVNAAKEIIEFVAQRRKQLGTNTFEIRIGVHSGSVVAGIVGVKKFSYDIWGDTVNTAARMEQASEAGKINISQATYELVKDKFTCTPRGAHEVKNKGKMEMYFVS